MANKFGKRSKERLDTCHSDLQKIMNKVIKLYDITVLEGHRSEERQNQLKHEGKSKLEWPNSKHNSNPSKAVDIAPYPIDWNNRERFYYMAGIVKAIADEMDIEIRWGGDWDSDGEFKDQSFDDLPHFELVD